MRRCSVLSTGRLQTDHVTALERLHTPVTVDRRCADLAELIAAAQTTRADAALIIGGTEQLTAAVLAGLGDQGLNVVVVSEVAAERQRLTGLGSVCFSDDADPEQLAEALADPQGVAGGSAEEPPADGLSADEFTRLMETNGMVDDLGHEASEPVQPGKAVGQVAGITTVWGAAGSPGRTTVAVNIAAELAISGARTLLIDADTYASSIAVHLGLLQESAGLAQACRAADLRRLDPVGLAAAATTVMLGNRRLTVLTGLPRADRWTEVRAHALELVLAQARADYDHIIIDTAPWIEHDEELSLDSAGTAAQRNAATRTALIHADTVFAVGGADPVGFARLIKAVQEMTENLPQAPEPQVIVNQLRKEVIGRSPRRQLSDAWAQLGPGGSIGSFLPWDQEACDLALRSGEVLAESGKNSGLRRHIASLVGVELSPRRRLLPGSGLRRRRRRGKVETPASRG